MALKLRHFFYLNAYGMFGFYVNKQKLLALNLPDNCWWQPNYLTSFMKMDDKFRNGNNNNDFLLLRFDEQTITNKQNWLFVIDQKNRDITSLKIKLTNIFSATKSESISCLSLAQNLILKRQIKFCFDEKTYTKQAKLTFCDWTKKSWNYITK